MGYLCVAKGRVQGVGFRYHTLKLAKHYKLTGWVRNDPTGTVTFEVHGEESNLSLFFEDLIRGNGFISIDQLEKSPIEYTSRYMTFEIVY